MEKSEKPNVNLFLLFTDISMASIDQNNGHVVQIVSNIQNDTCDTVAYGAVVLNCELPEVVVNNKTTNESESLFHLAGGINLLSLFKNYMYLIKILQTGAPESVDQSESATTGGEVGGTPNGESNVIRKGFKPLPSPFHVRGRRPSTGINKMDLISEE